jgi:cytoskeleton protein RodZ
MRGVSIAEISCATRISTKFLEAIENGKWDELPGGAFNRGYIRSTSRYLGLDEDGMVAEYALETNGNGTRVARRISLEVPRVPRRMALRIAVIAGATILFVALAWLATTRIPGLLHARWHAADAALPAPATALQPPAAPNSLPLQLVIRASSPTALRVSADGKFVLDRQVSANDEYQFDARDGFNVEASDGGAVHLELNGQPVPPIGPTHQHGSVTLTAKDLKSSAGGTH